MKKVSKLLLISILITALFSSSVFASATTLKIDGGTKNLNYTTKGRKEFCSRQ